MERDYVEDTTDDSWALHFVVSPEMQHGEPVSEDQAGSFLGGEYSCGMLFDIYGEPGWVLRYYEKGATGRCAVDLEYG